MANEYGYGEPKEKKSVWDTLATGVDKYFTLKTTQEQQELARIRLQQMVEQGKMTQQQADMQLASEMGATERFLAKVKANKTIIITLALAGVGIGAFIYFKKKK